MSVLLEKSLKDVRMAEDAMKYHDESYLDMCCYHMQQAIEKILKYSIEIKGKGYSYVHEIKKLYAEYTAAGWGKYELLEFMSGIITDWESASQYAGDFYATAKDNKLAKQIYTELYDRVQQYLYNNKRSVANILNATGTSEMSAFGNNRGGGL